MRHRKFNTFIKQKSSKITNLSSDTEKYFKAISGYDTCGDSGIIVKKIE